MEGDFRGQVVADFGGWSGRVRRQREAHGVRGLGGLSRVTGRGRQRTEVEIAEGEALDLVEAEAAEEDGAVSGVEFH